MQWHSALAYSFSYASTKSIKGFLKDMNYVEHNKKSEKELLGQKDR